VTHADRTAARASVHVAYIYSFQSHLGKWETQEKTFVFPAIGPPAVAIAFFPILACGKIFFKNATFGIEKRPFEEIQRQN